MSNINDFKIKDGVLVKYNGKNDMVVIPENITSIGDRAFKGCKKLTSVTIPEGVTSIGNSAFEECRSLTIVTIPEGVTSIGNSAFEECRSLTIVTIPESVTSIGGGAFYNCTNLTIVTIPEGVTSIGESVFSHCTNLTSVTIPEGVTSIGYCAFFCCTSLTSVTIPEGVTSIGDCAFEDCTNLTSVTIPNGVTSIGERAFRCCKNLTSVTIPEGVTSIGDCAFEDCTNLTSVTIPEGVTSIGDGAFRSCKGLKDNNGFVIVGNILFNYYGNDKDVIIPEGVTSIGDWAFYNCTNLTSVTIPDSVTSMGEKVFSYCYKIKDIILNKPSFVLTTKTLGIDIPENTMNTYRDVIIFILSDGMFVSSVLKTKIWKELSDDIKYKAYLKYQEKSVLKAYLNAIDSEIADKICQRLILDLAQSEDKNLCKAAVNLVLLFGELIPEGSLTELYNLLKNRKNAAKLMAEIEKNKNIMSRIGATDAKLSPIEEKIKEIFNASDMSTAKIASDLSTFYGLTLNDIPPVLDRDGNNVDPIIIAYLFTAHEEFVDRYVYAKNKNVIVSPEAKAVMDMLDSESFNKMLEEISEKYLGYSGYTRSMFLAFPICRYADTELMSKLCSKAVKWTSGVSGNDAPPLANFRRGCFFSNTRAAMMLCDRYDCLDQYADVRGTTADEIRDKCLSDVGLSEDGTKTYDLGNGTVTMRLTSELDYIFELPNGKTAKSLPKKGADEKKYALASSDFAEIKKNTKKIIKNRSSVLREEFFSGKSRDAEAWKAAYLKNPLLRSAAVLLVWMQGSTSFVLTDDGAINCNGEKYTINDKEEISVAHPMDMNKKEIEAWQKYFTSHGIKQLFVQIWEPVIDFTSIKPNRYEEIKIPYLRLTNMEKHGITVEERDYHNERYISLADCEAKIDVEIEQSHMLTMNDSVIISNLKANHTRRANHTIATLDKITVYGRIIKDDTSIELSLPSFTLAQIMDFIKIAGENNAVNVMALLLDYKSKNFGTNDVLEEFSLDF